MKKVCALGIVAAALTCLSLGAFAQVTKGKTRPLTTKQLMGGLVKPNCGGIGEGLKEAPKDDAGWAALACRAALLNEASYILMDDGRCPDKTWADAAKALREFARTNPLLVIKGGHLGGKSLSDSDVQALADLPSRDVLLAQLAGAFQAPMVKMAGLLQALPRNFAYGLKALIDQREAA